MGKNNLNPPQKSLSDDLHMLIKGGISCIPGGGGVLAELFASVITPSLERRRDEWMVQVALTLDELRKTNEGFSWERLTQDEAFIDVFLHASQIALRNHQAEKLIILRNAICNTALNVNINDTYKQIFLRYIDELTILHLLLLDLLNDPREWERKHKKEFPTAGGGGILYIIEHAIPNLTGKRDFCTLLIKDLQSRGLLLDFSLGATMTWDGIMSPRGSAMGRQFVLFISEPSGH